jgi:hypothetical protein
MKTLTNKYLIIKNSIKSKVWNDSWKFVKNNTLLSIMSRTNEKIFNQNKRSVDFVIDPIYENFRQF